MAHLLYYFYKCGCFNHTLFFFLKPINFLYIMSNFQYSPEQIAAMAAMNETVNTSKLFEGFGLFTVTKVTVKDALTANGTRLISFTVKAGDRVTKCDIFLSNKEVPASQAGNQLLIDKFGKSGYSLEFLDQKSARPAKEGEVEFTNFFRILTNARKEQENNLPLFWNDLVNSPEKATDFLTNVIKVNEKSIRTIGLQFYVKTDKNDPTKQYTTWFNNSKFVKAGWVCSKDKIEETMFNGEYSLVKALDKIREYEATTGKEYSKGVVVCHLRDYNENAEASVDSPNEELDLDLPF